jgi:uncharacterized paraquat-inducible protein A
VIRIRSRAVAANFRIMAAVMVCCPVEVDLESIVDDLPPLYRDFYGNEAARTCPHCKTLHPGKDPPAGWVQL